MLAPALEESSYLSLVRSAGNVATPWLLTPRVCGLPVLARTLEAFSRAGPSQALGTGGAGGTPAGSACAPALAASAGGTGARAGVPPLAGADALHESCAYFVLVSSLASAAQSECAAFAAVLAAQCMTSAAEEAGGRAETSMATFSAALKMAGHGNFGGATRVGALMGAVAELYGERAVRAMLGMPSDVPLTPIGFLVSHRVHVPGGADGEQATAWLVSVLVELVGRWAFGGAFWVKQHAFRASSFAEALRRASELPDTSDIAATFSDETGKLRSGSVRDLSYWAVDEQTLRIPCWGTRGAFVRAPGSRHALIESEGPAAAPRAREAAVASSLIDLLCAEIFWRASATSTRWRGMNERLRVLPERCARSPRPPPSPTARAREAGRPHTPLAAVPCAPRRAARHFAPFGPMAASRRARPHLHLSPLFSSHSTPTPAGTWARLSKTSSPPPTSYSSRR